MKIVKIWFNPIVAIIGVLCLLSSSCKKNEIIEEKDPLKGITLAPLTDNIPYEALGSGKILLERIDDGNQDNNGFYIIDIDKKETYGFRLNSLTTKPYISPDGTKIACMLLSSASWRSNWNIYIMNNDGSDCQPVFQSDAEWQCNPSWTPDGSKILYHLKHWGPLYMQSPIENAMDRVELTKFLYEDEPDYLISPEGGFSISPEQKLVCISSNNKPGGILSIVPYIGKAGVTILVPWPKPNNLGIYGRLASPVFSPDGLKIAYISMEEDSLGNEWTTVNSINSDGTDLTHLIKVKTFIPGAWWSGYGYSVSLCWSPVGSKILFTAVTEENSGYHLFIINADGSNLTQVTDKGLAYDFYVSWGK